MICPVGGLPIVRHNEIRNTSIPALYRQHELGKKREYGDRIREIEHASFTPLIFSTTGGLAKETQ